MPTVRNELLLNDESTTAGKFVRAFSLYSYHNEDYGLATFHTILGQILKNQRIKKGGSLLDPRISTFAMWGPSGGKSAALDLVMEVAEGVGLRFVTVDEATDAALVGTIEEKYIGKEKTYVTKYGFLGDADILHFDEADMLFRTGTHSQNTKSYLQKALNPISSETSQINKKLAHGEWIRFKPTCSLYLTSYLPSSFEEAVMGTGFFQRLLVVPKRLTVGQRLDNSMTDIELIGEKQPEAEVKSIIEKLMEVKREYSDPVAWDFDAVKPLLRNRIDRYYKFMQDLNVASQDVMLGFVPRYQNMLYSMAVHNAALRFDTTINKDDVKQADELVSDLLRRMVLLIETRTDTSRRGAKEEKRYEAAIITMLNRHADEDGWMGYNSLVDEVQRLWKMSKPTARELVNQHIGTVLEERLEGPARLVRMKQERLSS